ncbi:enoyl-CoA hydratase-related protein [Burkholderia multivorans]|uniref:enoyl-CoA hydratase-related protein n=1 Tax=Burkholderia multivorans TaxID=87883 RepID=UPI00018E3D02|nr:enoyl-CoA hydratase-related protein [Burkholderia multivorans]EED99763.1 enoyl-CoA hydratase/isomerase [Burkholderia multivorans CGD1]MDR8758928.1 Crotonyl-CoA hydratase [Burkholderia multivorans]MDR8767075.1 Crotonyl-CoA hydratase [Burkholderia multivorans]MDR8772793.1 Crotonyl-CoA hydratase [Burkholderia multivorans]MDR8789393.1 Crotonyl-CoA hydratase [Burkholderia multivorans]
MSGKDEISLEFVHGVVDTRGVAWVNLVRPEVRNAFNESMIDQLADCIRSLSSRAEVRLIVVASSGTAFCAGADMNWMKRASTNSFEANLEDARRFAAMMAVLHGSSKPTLARVQGGAFGLGVGLACACDVVIASERATFGVSESRFGILPAVIGPYLLEAVGTRQAKRLALTEVPTSAPEAKAIGLVHHVVPESELDACVERVVRDLLGNGPVALQEIKALFHSLTGRPINAETSELTAETIARVRATDEAKEGFAAFLEKRPASWTVS